MQVIQGKTFSGFRDRSGVTNIQDVELRRCRFSDCLVSTEDAAARPIFRRIKAMNCEELNSNLWECVFEDVTVEGLRVKDLFILADCAFKHVLLRGKIGRLKIVSGSAGLVRKRPRLQQNLDVANAAFYREVDWALDISAAEFEEFSISDVPLSLVRTDPETQAVMPASVTLGGEWRRVAEFAKVWGPQIDALLKVGIGPELLLVAAKRHRDFKRDLSAIKALRDSGLLP